MDLLVLQYCDKNKNEAFNYRVRYLQCPVMRLQCRRVFAVKIQSVFAALNHHDLARVKLSYIAKINEKDDWKHLIYWRRASLLGFCTSSQNYKNLHRLRRAAQILLERSKSGFIGSGMPKINRKGCWIVCFERSFVQDSVRMVWWELR